MYEIQRYALDNIYCSPSVDKQHRFKMLRVTTSGSVKHQVFYYDRYRPLPDNDDFYHVFVIGHLPAMVVNLLVKQKDWFRDTWVNVETDMNDRDYIMQVYDDLGLTIPRKYIYYSSGRNNELVIAIKDHKDIKGIFTIGDFQYMRVYSNIEFGMLTPTGTPVDRIFCESVVVSSVAVGNGLRNRANAKDPGNTGKILRYVNGVFVDRFTASNIPLDTVAEYVYDASIIERESINVNSLTTFQSDKDNRMKHLIIRNKPSTYIHYEDDLEVYVIDNKTSPYGKGYYYYQNKSHALNNVTDRDLAIDSIYLNSAISNINDLENFDMSKAKILIHTRLPQGGKPVIYNSTKVHELYRLSSNQQKSVMATGVNSIPEFRPEFLEDSTYARLMSVSRINDITPQLATEAVGYNAIVKQFGKAHINLNNTTGVGDIPSLYTGLGITVLEFDTTGLLLGFVNVPSVGLHYTRTNPDATNISIRMGNVNNTMKLYKANNTVPLKTTGLQEYRVYKATYVSNIRTTDWEDITGNSTYYTITGTNLKFKSGLTESFRIIYSDDVIIKTITIPDMFEDVGTFSLKVFDDRDGTNNEKLLDVPFENIEVYFQGRRMFTDIDYGIRFPQITVCNRNYDTGTPGSREVTFLCTGNVVTEDLINYNDVSGWITSDGYLLPKHYTTLEDKTYDVYIRGLLMKSSGTNTYDRALNSHVTTNNDNRGRPFMYHRPPSSIKNISGLDTYVFKQEAERLDKSIENLFKMILPTPPVDSYDNSFTKHNLYSTTITALIRDMLNGAIPSSFYNNTYSNGDVMDLVHDNYENYLSVDPVLKDWPIMVRIYTHPYSSVDLTASQFQLVNRFINIITNGNVSKVNTSTINLV